MFRMFLHQIPSSSTSSERLEVLSFYSGVNTQF